MTIEWVDQIRGGSSKKQKTSSSQAHQLIKPAHIKVKSTSYRSRPSILIQTVQSPVLKSIIMARPLFPALLVAFCLLAAQRAEAYPVFFSRVSGYKDGDALRLSRPFGAPGVALVSNSRASERRATNRAAAAAASITCRQQRFSPFRECAAQPLPSPITPPPTGGPRVRGAPAKGLRAARQAGEGQVRAPILVDQSLTDQPAA